MLMSNGMTEGQAEELALNGQIHGLEGPVVTVVTKHGIHRDLHDPDSLESNIDSYPATIVWTLHCSSNFRRTEAAFDEVKLRTGWGGRRRRRWFRRIGRFFRRVARRIGRVARRAWRAAKRFAKRIKQSIKSLAKCGLSAALPLATGGPLALGAIGKCATKKVNELKSEATNIVKDAKSEAKVLTNDIKGAAKGAVASAGVTVAHLYKTGENLKKKIKAGKVKATDAIQKMEDQAVMEIVNSTVAVNSQITKVKKHVAKGSKIVSKEGLKVAQTASDMVSKR